MRFACVILSLACLGASAPLPPMPPVIKPKAVAKPTGRASDLMTKLVVIKPARPFHISFAWDASDGADGYKLMAATNSLPSYRTNAYTGLSGTISNLWPNTSYSFFASATNAFGESGFSSSVVWPRPNTNYVALGWSKTAAGAWTTNTMLINPSGALKYRLAAPDVNTLQLQSSTDLRSWSMVTNWPAPAHGATLYIRILRFGGNDGVAQLD